MKHLGKPFTKKPIHWYYPEYSEHLRESIIEAVDFLEKDPHDDAVDMVHCSRGYCPNIGKVIEWLRKSIDVGDEK